MTLTPYIIFNGNCEEALNFYAKALGGEITNLSRFGDAPVEGMNADKQKVMHAHFNAKNFFIMASDNGNAAAAPEVGGMVNLSLSFGDAVGIEAAFNGLSEGATITMPLQDTFWGAKFGMLTDKFGVKWMFNWDKPKDQQ